MKHGGGARSDEELTTPWARWSGGGEDLKGRKAWARGTLYTQHVWFAGAL